MTDGTTAPALDHLVVNARFDIDRASTQFEQLGFTLAPRGRHPMGSINHLMVFGSDYLELVGLPSDGGPLRQEVLDSPVGIDGLVFRSHDAQVEHDRLAAAGVPIQPLHAFGRQVVLDGTTYDAAFRTVRLVPGVLSAGRVYFCEHLTPELVWRAEWQQHANGATALAGLLLVSDDVAAQADQYARVAGATVSRDGDRFRIAGPGYQVVVISHDTYHARFGALASQSGGRKHFFGAIAVRVPDVEHVARLHVNASEALPASRLSATELAVRMVDFDCLFSFVEDNAARPLWG